jgi:hypothetical protein
VKAHGEPIGAVRFCHAQDARNDADCADGDFGWSDAAPTDVGQDVESGHDRVVVVERLPHSHQDEVPHPALGGNGVEHTTGMEDLRNDFTRTQVAHEPHLPGGAKYTPHGTARLSADADRVASLIAHENGFDDLTVCKAQQELASQAVAAVDFVHDFQRFGQPSESGLRFAPTCQGGKKSGVGEGLCRVSVERAPECFGVVWIQPIRSHGGCEFAEAKIIQRVTGFRHGEHGEGKWRVSRQGRRWSRSPA